MKNNLAIVSAKADQLINDLTLIGVNRAKSNSVKDGWPLIEVLIETL